MTVTASAFKRLFVGRDAKYAVLGEDADLVRVSGESGDILTVGESVFGEGDYVEIAGALRQKGGGIFDVKAYGAKGDGITDDRVAIQAAINAASAATYGGVVFIPPGLYRINRAVGGLVAKSNVTLRGSSPNQSTIWCDDELGETSGGVLHNVTTFPTFTTLTNFRMESLGFKGRADVNKTLAASQMIAIGNCNDLQVHNCWFTWARNAGIVIHGSRRVVVTNCRAAYTFGDGIDVWNSSDIIIANNEIYRANDDAIGCHSDDFWPEPTRSGVLIANNMITESQGISAIGGKTIVIANNVLRRVMAIAIRVRSSTVENLQGQTSQFSCKIVGNVINDVIKRMEPTPRTSSHFGIMISGGVRDAGAGTSPPGEPTSGTGTVTSLYGTNGVGTLYLNETGAAGTPQAAGYGLEVRDNILIRTLPAVTTVSQWGYGSDGLWVGNNGDGTGYFNGAITDAALSPVALTIDPAMWDCRISGNIFRTGGTSGIEFRATETVGHGDFRGLTIDNNKISDFTASGIKMPTTATTQRILIRHNDFDGDPRFVSSNRGAGGTWVTGTAPLGIDAQTSGGFIIEGNHFRNVAASVGYPSDQSTFTSLRDNYQYGTIAGLNFNAGNKGVGTMAPSGLLGWTTIPEDSDPTSATYGRLLAEVERARSTIPTTGTYTRGHVVWNTNPVQSGGKVLLGWARLTTGSGHVLNTDWSALYATTT